MSWCHYGTLDESYLRDDSCRHGEVRQLRIRGHQSLTAGRWCELLGARLRVYDKVMKGEAVAVNITGRSCAVRHTLKLPACQ